VQGLRTKSAIVSFQSITDQMLLCRRNFFKRMKPFKSSMFPYFVMMWWTGVSFAIQGTQWFLMASGRRLALGFNWLERRRPGIDRRFCAAEAKFNAWHQANKL
jgi:hypothetical protein